MVRDWTMLRRFALVVMAPPAPTCWEVANLYAVRILASRHVLGLVHSLVPLVLIVLHLSRAGGY